MIHICVYVGVVILEDLLVVSWVRERERERGREREREKKRTEGKDFGAQPLHPQEYTHVCGMRDILDAVILILNPIEQRK